MTLAWWRRAAICFVVFASSPAFAEPVASGRVLAAGCSSCHGLSGTTVGIPVLASMDQVHIEESLLAYRTGRRRNQIMQVVAASLTPDEIAQVSRYLASPPSEAPR